MTGFIATWHTAVRTAIGLFWMAFWAFGFGYLVSSMIQVFVTRERMKQAMGDTGAKSVGLGTVFGFASSSCSFAALATTRALFTKGAGFVPALAFLLASTNLVIELGIVISIFLAWQFVVAEYLGGLILIALMWAIVAATAPDGLIEGARRHARDEAGDKEGGDIPDWRRLIRSREGWGKVADRYVMEWRMVWKDVTVGFTVAGIIAAFVPQGFFQALFVGSRSDDPAFWQLLVQALVGPVAAFFTFIGSMGNIPLAAVLYDNGVSFAGIVAFIFSDLVVVPVLRIQAQYYGWRMALYILAVFLTIIVAAALILHYGFAATGLLPQGAEGGSVTGQDFFAIDYGFWLNLAFLLLSGVAFAWKACSTGFAEMSGSFADTVLRILAFIAFAWLTGGMFAGLLNGSVTGS